MTNSLLALLSLDDFALLAPHLAPIDLPQDTTLSEPDEAIERIVFPDTAVGSLVIRTLTGPSAEVGLVGREGLIGKSIVNGVDRSPLQAFMRSTPTAARSRNCPSSTRSRGAARATA